MSGLLLARYRWLAAGWLAGWPSLAAAALQSYIFTILISERADVQL
jgi:hypothetical protein